MTQGRATQCLSEFRESERPRSRFGEGLRIIRGPRGAWRFGVGIASKTNELQTSGAVDFVSGGDSTNSLGLRRFGRVLLPLCVVALVLLTNARLSAEVNSLSVQVGFDQSFQVGQWTPIVVENVSAEAQSCEVIVVDPDGLGISHPLTRQVSDGVNTAVRWTGVVRCGRLDGGLEVRVLSTDKRTIQQRKVLAAKASHGAVDGPARDEATTCYPLRQSEPVWLEIGTANELLKSVGSIHAIRSETLPGTVEIPLSLDGVNGIWLTSRVALSDPARVELERWLRRGGHLVLAITTDADEFEETPWSRLLKGIVEARGRSRTTDLSGIEALTVQGRKILGANRTPVPVTTLSRSEGLIMASCLEGPLLTRSCFGFGLITVIGVDPAVPPISRWDGRSNFIKRLLLPSNDAESAKVPARSSLSQSGITDLASQWRAAAIQIPGIERPTLWGALGLLLVYATVIGPLDYLLVHKLLKRPHWTWASLPLLVAVASLGTVWLAHAVNGDAAKLTQLDVVDIDAGRQEVIARSWTTAYSTENARWKVETLPTQITAKQPQRILSWLGFPENASGGMYRDSGFDIGHAVAQSAGDRSFLGELPVAQWSSKSLTSETIWVSESPLIESELTSSAAGALDGRVLHHLPFDLHDWVIVFDKWIYRPHPKFGEAATVWPPDQPWTPKDDRNYGRELRGFLQRTTWTKSQSKKGAVSEDVLKEKERYNPLSLDPADILQMMTLHEAAGGKGYTGLDHQSLRGFDVTQLLSLDRAIVIARVTEPTTAWKFNGEVRPPTRHHSFIRILLPVRRIGEVGGYRYMPKLEPNAQPPANKETDKTPSEKASVPNETKTP